MNSVVIRPASPEDAKSIQEVLYRTWLETYPNDSAGITMQDIETFFKDSFSDENIEDWRRNIVSLGDDCRLLVAADAQKIVGVCRAYRREKHNEVQAIYVLPAYQGRGIGKQFFVALHGFFNPQKDITVQVATYNTKAVTFYEKLGFKDTGKRFSQPWLKMPVSGNMIPEMELRKEKEQG